MNVKKIITLNNGVRMPSLGLGVFKIPKGAKTEESVISALKAGYRMIDTAAFYGNEVDVGRAIDKSGIPRNEVFVTTKLHPLRIFNIKSAFHASLKRLGLDYIDLYLIHWPFLRTNHIWKELENIYTQGYVRSIGVSNFGVKDLQTLINESKIIPAVNQVEFHPFIYRNKLLSYCVAHRIVVEAHSPLTHGKRLDNQIIKELAKKYNKSESQIMIRWALQHGAVVIPKSTRKDHIKQNIRVFNFTINKKDMIILDNLSENYHVAWISKILNR